MTVLEIWFSVAFVVGAIAGALLQRRFGGWHFCSRKMPDTHCPIIIAYGLCVSKGYLDDDGHWWDMSDMSSPLPDGWVHAWRDLPMSPKNRLQMGPEL